MGQGAEKGEESLPEVWEEDWAGFHIHLQVSVWVCCVRVTCSVTSAPSSQVWRCVLLPSSLC